MIGAKLSARYDYFVIALILSFPLVINSVKIIGNLILLILVFFGIYVLFKERRSPFKIPELQVFSYITFGYFAVMLISIVQTEGWINELSHLGRKAHFALAPLIALAIYKVNIPFKQLLISFKFGLILIGLILIYQDLQGSDRPSGMINANIFGDIALSSVFISLVNFFNEKLKEKLFTLVSVGLGVYAVVLSGNRGTFLTLIILSLVYFLTIYKKQLSGNLKRVVSVIFFIFLTIYAVSIHPRTQSGINRAVDNTLSWVSGDEIQSSAGERLEMWKAGLKAFKDSPLIGYGYRNSTAAAQNYTSQDIKQYTHLHSEYVTNLVSAGIIGLLSMLALLVIPLRYFLMSLHEDKAHQYCVAGILLCASYMSLGITHIAFGEEHINAFFVLLLAFLLTKVTTKTKCYYEVSP